MRWYLAAGIPLLLVYLQAGIVPAAALWGARPDLAVLAVMSWTLLRGSDEGLAWAVIAGVYLGLFSATPIGAPVAGLAVTSFLVGIVGPWLRRYRTSLPLALLPISVVVHYVVAQSFLAATGYTVSWADTMAGIPAIVLVDAIAGLPVYLALAIVAATLRQTAWQPS